MTTRLQARRAPAVRKTLQVLVFLASRQGPVSAGTIAAALELPRSTIYQILAAMTEEGFVLHFPEERLYGLGYRATELSFAYTRHSPLARIGRPLVDVLVDRTRESAEIAVMHGREITYVVATQWQHRVSAVVRTGIRLPAHLTATGRAMLAVMPRDQVTALFPDRTVFPSLTDLDSILSPRSLHQELDRTRRRGYAVEQGAVEAELSTVACPVLDHAGLPVAAIGVTFRSDSADEQRQSDIARHTAEAAEALSKRIGGRDRARSARGSPKARPAETPLVRPRGAPE